MNGSHYRNEHVVGPTNGWQKPHPEITYSPRISLQINSIQDFPLSISCITRVAQASRRVVESKITPFERTLIDNWADNPQPTSKTNQSHQIQNSKREKERGGRGEGIPVLLLIVSSNFGLVLRLARIQRVKYGCAHKCSNGSRSSLRQRIQIKTHNPLLKFYLHEMKLYIALDWGINKLKILKWLEEGFLWIYRVDRIGIRNRKLMMGFPLSASDFLSLLLSKVSVFERKKALFGPWKGKEMKMRGKYKEKFTIYYIWNFFFCFFFHKIIRGNIF